MAVAVARLKATVMTSAADETFTTGNSPAQSELTAEVSARRKSRRQANRKLALIPCSLAMADADAPG